MASRRRRARWWLKWAGISVCLVALLLWSLRVVELALDGANVPGYPLAAGHVTIFRDQNGLQCRAWSVTARTNAPLWALAKWGICWPRYETSGGPYRSPRVELPLSSVVVLVGLPTAYLWWRDRRPPPGHCQKCGYNLTDNVSGVCPECGTEVERPRAKAEVNR